MAEHRKRESVRSVCWSMLGQEDENHAFVALPPVRKRVDFHTCGSNTVKKIKHTILWTFFTLSCTGGSTKISSFLETVCFVHQITVDRGGHWSCCTMHQLLNE